MGKNCNDLSGIKGVTGSVKYDPATKTLTLENATITGIGNERCLFNSECEGLRIVLKGSNRIVNNEEVGMEFRSATTICGPGTLDIRTKKKEAILFIYVPLTIEDCEITINSEHTGIVGGFISEKSVLTVRNSRVDVNAKMVVLCISEELFSKTVQLCSLRGWCSIKDVCRWLLTVRL